MRACALGAMAALSLAMGAACEARAQDSARAAPLGVEAARVAAFRREYRMLVHAADSVALIGTRTVDVAPATFAAAPAWLVVETRTGAVAAAESLYVAAVDGRPVQWSSTLGPSRLAIAFTRDSMLGATSGPGGRRNFVHALAPNPIASIAMLELLLPAVPLTPFWTDSVSVVMVDHAGSAVIRAELAVIGETELEAADGLAAAARRPAWIVVLRAPGPRTVLLWVDKADGRLLLLQQPLPLHLGSLLEYRPVSSR